MWAKSRFASFALTLTGALSLGFPGRFVASELFYLPDVYESIQAENQHQAQDLLAQLQAKTT